MSFKLYHSLVLLAGNWKQEIITSLLVIPEHTFENESTRKVIILFVNSTCISLKSVSCCLGRSHKLDYDGTCR